MVVDYRFCLALVDFELSLECEKHFPFVGTFLPLVPPSIYSERQKNTRDNRSTLNQYSWPRNSARFCHIRDFRNKACNE